MSSSRRRLWVGKEARAPVTGIGQELVPALPTLSHPHIEILAHDVYISGRLRDAEPAQVTEA